MIAALAAVGVFCGYKYYTEVKRPEMELDAAADAQDVLFEEIRQGFSEPVTVPATAATAAGTGQTPSETAPSEPRSAAVAWLTIPGTHIDYPVAQAADNEFYLYRGIDGELNQRLGCPFLDFRCASDFSGFNSIVYAHHMTKQRMFADIALYQDSRFMGSCPTATLTTPGGQNTVRFFAYLTVPSTDAVYETYFESDEERAACAVRAIESGKQSADALRPYLDRLGNCQYYELTGSRYIHMQKPMQCAVLFTQFLMQLESE